MMPGVQDLFGMTTKRHFHPGAQTKEILNTPHHRRTTSNVRAPLLRRRVADVATTEQEHERARSLFSRIIPRIQIIFRLS